MAEALLKLRVHAMTYEADGIFSFDLRSPDGSELPAFTAGAHLDVCIAPEMERSYSLTNPQDERHRYVIAVCRDAASRGGSKFMCETVRVGDMLTIRAPSNTFELAETPAESVFIGGGIGITPLLGMIRRLEAQGAAWSLHYAARTRNVAAFQDEFAALERVKPGRVHITFDHEPGAAKLDLAAIFGKAVPEAHIYCCGPTGMLLAFEAAAAARAPETVHREYFSPTQEAARGGFTVELRRSKKSFLVPVDKSILQTLLDNGCRVNHSCTEGVCGTCETRVLEGIPDHRDNVLSPREKAANKAMMICCSGAKTEKLVLDI
jgi:vanillate O-demethylase ferredoxin subunit